MADLLTIGRDPNVGPRTLEFMQRVALIFNSLLRSGQITPSGTGWVIKLLNSGQLPTISTDDSGGESSMMIPGLTGAPGVQGIPGPALFFQGDEGEQGFSIPGPTGPAGSAGLMAMMQGEVGEDGMTIPGLQGLAGVNAATNFLINGSFRLYQRQTPGTLTTITADKYGPDRWRSAAENASVQAQRVDSSGAVPSGTTSRYNGLYKKITSTGKFFFCQPVEGELSCSQQGKTVTFQIQLSASASKTIRLGVLGSTNAIDALPTNIVPTTWGANSTDPTWGTGLSLMTPVAVPVGASGTISGSAVNCSVTTVFQTFAVTVTVPTSCVNVIPIIWTDSQFAANDTLSECEAGLYPSSVLQAWIPRSAAHEDLLAQRYYEKSWNVDTTPGTTWTKGNFAHIMILCTDASTGVTGIVCPFNTRKRANPTATFYDSAGTAGKADYFDGAAWQANGTIGSGALEHAIFCQVATSGAIQFAFTAEIEL